MTLVFRLLPAILAAAVLGLAAPSPTTVTSPRLVAADITEPPSTSGSPAPGTDGAAVTSGTVTPSRHHWSDHWDGDWDDDWCHHNDDRFGGRFDHNRIDHNGNNGLVFLGGL